MTEKNEKDWTIMVYMSGDNSLSENMAKAIYDTKNTMKPNGKVSLLVYFDSKVSAVEPKYYDIMDDANSVNVKDSQTFQKFINKKRASASIKENSSSKDSIVNFVKWCVKEKQNRAMNYALFLSGHSNAFDDATLLKDGNSKKVLTIPELKRTLKKVNKIIRTNDSPDKMLDIIGFDSCVMNLLEITYEFKGLAKFMIASQGNTPAAGFDYAKILNESVLSSSNRMDGEVLSNEIVENFIEQQAAFLEGGRSADLSALNLQQTTSVIKKVKKLFNLIYDLRKQKIDRFLDNYPDSFNNDEKRQGIKFIVANQVEKLLLSAHWNCQTYWFEQAIDIYDFCEKLFLDIDPLHLQYSNYDDANSLVFQDILDEIAKACNGVKNVIENKFVIATGSCGADFQFARGTSLFFPWSVKAYRELALPYLSLDFAQDNAGDFWIEFIEDNLLCTLKRVRPEGGKPFNRVTDAATANGNGFHYLNLVRGTSTDKDRGTSTDKDRGTSTDKDRGTSTDKDRGTSTDKDRGFDAAFVRGTSTDKDRGTSTDKDRGTSTDKDRGVSFIEAFSTFKNFDPDYWDYLEKSSFKKRKKTLKRRDFKLSEDYESLKSNASKRFIGKPKE